MFTIVWGSAIITPILWMSKVRYKEMGWLAKVRLLVSDRDRVCPDSMLLPQVIGFVIIICWENKNVRNHTPILGSISSFHTCYISPSPYINSETWVFLSLTYRWGSRFSGSSKIKQWEKHGQGWNTDCPMSVKGSLHRTTLHFARKILG